MHKNRFCNFVIVNGVYSKHRIVSQEFQQIVLIRIHSQNLTFAFEKEWPNILNVLSPIIDMLTADNLFHSLIIWWTNILNQLSEITQFVTLWKTCTVWWPVLHTFPPLSQWAIFVTVWKEKLGKMLIKIWWLDIGVTYELTVCTLSGALCTHQSWSELSEQEKLHWVFCCALWKLAPTEPGRSAAVHSRSLAGSMFQIETRCSV